MSRYKSCQHIGLVKYYTLYGCVWYLFCRAGHVFCGGFGVFGGGTRLAMPKTIYAPDTSSLKPGSGATEGVLDYGVLGRPGYVTWDRRLPPKSGWDSP